MESYNFWPSHPRFMLFTCLPWDNATHSDCATCFLVWPFFPSLCVELFLCRFALMTSCLWTRFHLFFSWLYETLPWVLLRQEFFCFAGELHAGAGQLEAQLSRIFKIASHWNAILLLDEADVYLEQLSSHDMVRNGLVSVFLRKLEYCEGVLFLNTNRVREFDDAILSRIHVMLRYDDLSSDSRKQIWEHFLSNVQEQWM